MSRNEARAVGWSQKSAHKRYKYIGDQIENEGFKEVVDFGCGLGGLSKFLSGHQYKKNDIIFYNYDLNIISNIINKITNPNYKNNIHIYTWNKLKKISQDKCFVAIGIFNVGYNEELVLEKIKQLFGELKINCFIFTLLDIKNENKNEKYFVKKLNNKYIICELEKLFDIQLYPKYLEHDLTIKLGKKSENISFQ
jgi:hypothetical protein